MMAAVRVCGLVVTCLVCLVLTRSVDSNTRPRGVAISKTSFYDPSRPFSCFDGSKTIEFSEVNDDYCDCPDGSDEPGTPACSNGYFHCTNAGHKPLYIHSSKVNDGVCDCCDTTDEYDETTKCNTITKCNNNCKELGAVAREEKKKDLEKQQQGYQMRSEYSQSGKDKKEDRKNRKSELENELREINDEMSRLEAIKKEAEEKAEAAKQEHINQWKAEKERKDKDAADEAFQLLDIDQDGILSIAEMQAKLEFDKDKDGVVSPEEAQEYLNQTTDVNRDNFFVVCWSIIKDVFPPAPEVPTEEESTLVPPAGMPEIKVPEASEESPTEPTETRDEETDNAIDELGDGDDTDEDDEDDDDEDDDEEPADEKPLVEPDLEGMPEFDDQTKLLIETADNAAAEFRTVSERHSGKKDEMNNIDKDLQLDLGPDEEYYPLQGHCYDFTDREYTYSLCPFDKVTQKPKHGGRETLLGNWGEFSGDGGDKYSRMSYTGGEKCWNGPDRQAKITLKCGVTNELVSASEPNRCEYAMDFVTPAVCKPHLHEEL